MEIRMETEEKKERLLYATFVVSNLLREFNWDMHFPNRDLSVTLIEAQAKLIEANKKFNKIINEINKVDR